MSRVTDMYRFWGRVGIDAPDKCWLYGDNKSYGLITWRGRLRRAHRVSYEIMNGPVLDELSVCHSCDNPRCVNPRHLFLGTHAENMADKAMKWRCGTNRLTEAQVLKIRADDRASRVLAREYGVSHVAIQKIKDGRSYAHVA